MGHDGVAELLIEAQADLDHADERGWTPLMAAIYGDHQEIALSLIAAGARTDAKSTHMYVVSPDVAIGSQAGHVFYPPGSKAVDIADNSNNGLLRDIFSGDDESKAGGTNAKVKLEALGGVGSAAEVRLQGVSIWLEGVIKDINEDGTFEVSFNNGDRENGVPFHRIRAKGALRPSASYEAVVGLSDDSIEDADLSLSWLQFNATKDEFYRERLEVCRLEDQPAINAAHQNLERKASSQVINPRRLMLVLHNLSRPKKKAAIEKMLERLNTKFSTREPKQAWWKPLRLDSPFFAGKIL